MTSAFYSLAAMLMTGVATLAVASSALAQAQFRDEKTGKIWTPDNVSKEIQLRPSNEPVTPADRAFDPNAQIATATGVVHPAPGSQPDGRSAHHGGADRTPGDDRDAAVAGDSGRSMGRADLFHQQQRRRRQRSTWLHLHQRQSSGAGEPHRRADGGAGPAAGVRGIWSANRHLRRPRGLSRPYALNHVAFRIAGNRPGDRPVSLWGVAQSPLRCPPDLGDRQGWGRDAYWCVWP